MQVKCECMKLLGIMQSRFNLWSALKFRFSVETCQLCAVYLGLDMTQNTATEAR